MAKLGLFTSEIDAIFEACNETVYLDVTLNTAHHCTGKLEVVKTKSTVNKNWGDVYGLIWHGQTVANIDVQPPVPVMEFQTYYNTSSGSWETIIGVYDTQQTIQSNSVLKVTCNGITKEIPWTSLNLDFGSTPHNNFNIPGDVFNLADLAGQTVDFEISW